MVLKWKIYLPVIDINVVHKDTMDKDTMDRKGDNIHLVNKEEE